MDKLALVIDILACVMESVKIQSLRKNLFVFGTLVTMKTAKIKKFLVQTFVLVTFAPSKDVFSRKKSAKNQRCTSVKEKVAKICNAKDLDSVQNTNALLRIVAKSNTRLIPDQNFVIGTNADAQVAFPSQFGVMCVWNVLGYASPLLMINLRRSGSSVLLPFSSNVAVSNTIVPFVTLFSDRNVGIIVLKRYFLG